MKSLSVQCPGHSLGGMLRALQTRSFSSQAAATPANSIRDILNKPKHVPDHLSPTNSRLLTLSLSDYLPPECLAPLQPQPSPSRKPAHPLPQGHHLVYFPIQARPSELHPDGTDADHWPGRPFMRRMWAGGEVLFRPGWEKDMPLDGREAVCTETVEEVRLSGEGDKAKAFVDVWRRYTVADGGSDAAPAIEERRTLVFMPEVEALTGDVAAAAAKSPPRIVKSPHTPDYAFALTPNRALLANFSALTYNAHSIHLDGALTLAEGPRALLVHGPLTLALAFAALRGAAPREGVRRLEYRNVGPLYCGERLRVCVREKEAGSRTGPADERRWDVWVEGPAGGMAVKGTAVTGAF
ncbi:hypothetical protein D7B24_000804 [Verticillium nonalfalfae]|uniref:MaoC-like domain-containing protein n=1 Tax=Verticillium nonalfalfae TaxID=1051616 RepID=A0A3M9Y125_9PEZI|nr:uncharacterized protein D7B24_000804 [Verticillium nonalfalfae]RNJ54207.1 hypothetical protein D7B24_000804 [Verticillium nonalfalfae]